MPTLKPFDRYDPILASTLDRAWNEDMVTIRLNSRAEVEALRQQFYAIRRVARASEKAKIRRQAARWDTLTFRRVGTRLIIHVADAQTSIDALRNAS